MTDDLLAYLLDDLTPERRTEVERQLEQHAAWRRELRRLQACLAAHGESFASPDQPPGDLVTRTCTLVEHAGPCVGENGPFDPAALALVPATTTVAAGGRGFSLTDWAVTGGVMLLFGFLLAPALLESREAARAVTCQDNLRWLGAKMFEFQEQWGQQLPPIEPGEHTGAYATKLVELGGVDRAELSRRMICPNSKMSQDIAAGRIIYFIPTQRELDESHGEKHLELVKLSRGVYAMRMGNFDAHDFFHLARFTGCQSKPLMADPPDFARPGEGGSNHPGGQHVLFETLNVSFRTNDHLVGGEHLYRNAAGNLAAGCDSQAAVLSAGDAGPTGQFIFPEDLGR